MAGLTIATNIALEGGATIDNLRIQAKNTLPSSENASLGDIILFGDSIYVWGLNESTGGFQWVKIGQRVSSNGLDELGEYPNTLFSENQGRLLFNSISSLNTTLGELCGFRELNLSNAPAISEITAVTPTDPYFANTALRAYVVTASAANKIVRVKNTLNQIANDTVPLLANDILLPVYQASDNSWRYHVVRMPSGGSGGGGSSVLKKFHRLVTIFEQTYTPAVQHGENVLVISCEDVFVDIAHDGTANKIYDNTVNITGASVGIRFRFEAGIQVTLIDYTSGASSTVLGGNILVASNARLRIVGGDGFAYIYKS